MANKKIFKRVFIDLFITNAKLLLFPPLFKYNPTKVSALNRLLNATFRLIYLEKVEKNPQQFKELIKFILKK